MPEPEELLREGRLDDALAQVKDQIRQDPAKADLRVYLFQLLCIQGDWERALTQLNVAVEMDGEKMLLAEICRPALQCEAFRSAVFAGERSPLVFGEPPEWIGRLIQANELLAQGQFGPALALRDQAFEAAPAVSGRVNGEPFEWIADGDTRLGPVVEAVVDRKYFWIPFSRIRSIRIEAPQALRNVVWAEAQFTWANGGQAPGLIPARYVGSESSDDPLLRLGRKTDWIEREGGHYLGLGQRMLNTDEREYPLLEVRSIELDVEESGAPADVPAEASFELSSGPPPAEEPSDG